MLLLQLVEVAPVVAVLNADCRLFLLLFLCGCVAQLDFRFAHCLLTRPVNIYHLLQGSAEHTGHAAPAAKWIKAQDHWLQIVHNISDR